MEPRRISPCEKITRSFSQSWNYLYDHIVTPMGNNKSWTVQATAYLAALGFVGVTTAQSIHAQTNDVSYTVARTSGALLRYVLVPTVILPTLTGLISRLQRSGISRYLALNNRILTHRLIAYGVIGATAVHAVGHYMFNKDNYIKQPGITGILMIGTLLGPLAGVYFLHWCKPNKFGSYSLLVKRPHQIGAGIFLVLYAMHTVDLRLVPYSGAIAALLGANLFYDFYSLRHQVRVRGLDPILNTDFVLLSVSLPPFFNINNYLPGQYAELSIPAIDGCCEYPHSFTIVNVNEKEINFLIKKSLEWTSNLVKLSIKKSLIDIPVTLWGPYGSPLNSFYKKTDMTIIAAGSGITPFLAFIFWLVSKNAEYPHLYLHISAQKMEDASIFLEAFAHPDINRIAFVKTLDFYVTRQNDTTIKKFIDEINVEKKNVKRYRHLDFQYLNSKAKNDHFVKVNDKEYSSSISIDYSMDEAPPLLEVKEEKKTPVYTPSSVNSQYPSFKNLSFFPFRNTREKLPFYIHSETRMNIDGIVENSPSQHIFTCGSPAMVEEVQASVRKHHKKFYKESF